MRRTTATARVYRGFREPTGWVWRCSRAACLIRYDDDPRHGYQVADLTWREAVDAALLHLATHHRTGVTE